MVRVEFQGFKNLYGSGKPVAIVNVVETRDVVNTRVLGTYWLNRTPVFKVNKRGVYLLLTYMERDEYTGETRYTMIALIEPREGEEWTVGGARIVNGRVHSYTVVKGKLDYSGVLKRMKGDLSVNTEQLEKLDKDSFWASVKIYLLNEVCNGCLNGLWEFEDHVEKTLYRYVLDMARELSREERVKLCRELVGGGDG